MHFVRAKHGHRGVRVGEATKVREQVRDPVFKERFEGFFHSSGFFWSSSCGCQVSSFQQGGNCGRCLGRGTATLIQQTSGVWPAEFGQLWKLLMMMNLSGVILPMVPEPPNCLRCLIVQEHHMTFSMPSSKICWRLRVHHVCCRGSWVADGWCWSTVAQKHATICTRRNV